eukprot:scaffold241583_cov30-Tisochrysis_lutea.AAC.1
MSVAWTWWCAARVEQVPKSACQVVHARDGVALERRVRLVRGAAKHDQDGPPAQHGGDARVAEAGPLRRGWLCAPAVRRLERH